MAEIENLIIVRGGGDIATGTIYKLKQSGFAVLILEIEHPSAIRRNVAFSEAVYEGTQKVEDLTCYKADSLEEAEQFLREGKLTLLVDPDAACLKKFTPIALVDGILAKKNLGTTRDMAGITVALGPGFEAGKDVDAVIETKRGHRLGRVIYQGCAIKNTGVPGVIAGESVKRVIHAPAKGILKNINKVTDTVKEGDLIALIQKENGEEVPVKASLTGLLRGLIRDGYPVTEGFKIADIDPRVSEYENCFTISDKARCIAGGVLEAILCLQEKQRKLLKEQPEKEHSREGKKIYADHGATSFPKPKKVQQAVVYAMEHFANADRGVYQDAMTTGRAIYQARKKVAGFFQVESPEQVAFTSGVTESVNLALKGILKPKDHVITTYMEHNSVLRPLYQLEETGVELTITAPEVESILGAVQENTKAVVMTHGSNVTGEVYDIRTLGRELRKRGITFLVDCAQTAGIFPISMQEDCIDILCFSGHKGLLGPTGIGGICVGTGISMTPCLSGGTGIRSFEKTQPKEMPMLLEAGTRNIPGIMGLAAGIDFIEEMGMTALREREQELAAYFYAQVKNLNGIQFYGVTEDFSRRTATLAFNIGDFDGAAVSDELAERFGIETRAGAHCAPLVHEHFHTEEQGMVRISFGYNTTREDVDQIVNSLKEMIEENQ